MGVCLALELAQRGYKVDLIDQGSVPVTGASLHNEGKLHLGFVYAKDPSKTTHQLMARGSLSFTRIIRKLTGCQTADMRPSQPFHYFVPIDSQLGLESIHRHFVEVEQTLQQVSQISGDTYLDHKLDHYFEPNGTTIHNKIFSPAATLGSFRTEELSVSPSAVANLLRQAVKHQPNINFMGNTTVLSVHKLANDCVEIESRRANKTSKNIYACAANCLWNDKLRIDDSFGAHNPGPWILRYKATINISATARKHIPSATGILGRYGDVVHHSDGSIYISWYPLCKLAEVIHGDGRDLQDMLHPGRLARSVRQAVSGFPPVSKLIASVAHKKFVGDNISEMAVYIPRMAELLPTAKRWAVGGGVILARGQTDIDDPVSQLHQRSEIGPIAYGSYISIDTGKYCTAPLFAEQAADMVTDIL